MPPLKAWRCAPRSAEGAGWCLPRSSGRPKSLAAVHVRWLFLLANGSTAFSVHEVKCVRSCCCGWCAVKLVLILLCFVGKLAGCKCCPLKGAVARDVRAREDAVLGPCDS